MTARVTELALLTTRFARVRWGWRFHDREALTAWQGRRLERFLRERLPLAPFYGRPASRLSELPIVDKRTLVDEFDGLNTRGIRRAEAMAAALAAERSRDFRPELAGVTVGLSSGTSGERGLFLVSRRERLVWAATMLARTLSVESLSRLASPWRAPLVIAFFLRANSNLYTTLHSRRVSFRFYDLLAPIETHFASLATSPPEVLVAPASVLRSLADAARDGRLPIRPRQVVSVAETLEVEDARAIEQAFGRPVQQIYQATEGFLGYSCAAGRVHLNEECLHIEPEWLDDARTRFHPIVTDFTRETQLFVRYRLDDVLRVADGPCSCGRVTRSLAGIDGRRDGVLWLPAQGDGALRPVFPDLMRRAMVLAGDRIRDYRIVQTGAGLLVRLASSDPDASGRVRDEISALCASLGVVVPAITVAPWRDDPPGAKRCRIRRDVTTSNRLPEAIA